VLIYIYLYTRLFVKQMDEIPIRCKFILWFYGFYRGVLWFSKKILTFFPPFPLKLTIYKTDKLNRKKLTCSRRYTHIYIYIHQLHEHKDRFLLVTFSIWIQTSLVIIPAVVKYSTSDRDCGWRVTGGREVQCKITLDANVLTE